LDHPDLRPRHGSIGEFANYPQPMLKEFYRRYMQGPIDFGFGYRHRSNESGIVLAVSKEHIRPETTAAGSPALRSPQPVPSAPAPSAPSRPFQPQLKPMQPQPTTPRGVRDIAH
jgi:hypothetical protein